MLRGKKADEVIIKMMEAYLKLYETGNPEGWENFGGADGCKMCQFVKSETGKLDCSKCPLTDKGYISYEGTPCIRHDYDSLFKLCDMLTLVFDGVEEVDKEVVKARMKFLYKRLKENGYFE